MHYEHVTCYACSHSCLIVLSENLCPITFEKPPVANDSSTIPLKCSTLMSCPSDLEMRQSTQLLETKSQPNEGKMKSINISLTVNWQDNGKEVSCQTKDNKDPYLIQKTSLTVQCKFMTFKLSPFSPLFMLSADIIISL